MEFKEVKEELLPEVLDITKRVIPIMQSKGNLQWSDKYPNKEIFLEDIRCGNLIGLFNEEDTLCGFYALVNEEENEYESIEWNYQSEPNSVGVIHRVAIDPTQQGRGYSHALLQNAAQVAKNRHLTLLRTDTNEKNDIVNALLCSEGFERIPGTFQLDDRDVSDGEFIAYEKHL